MNRRGGFLLIEVLIAVGILAAAMLGVSEALSGAGAADRRSVLRESIADCAEARLAITLIGNNAPDLPCAPGLRVEMDSALPLGDMEQVTWRISAGGGMEERFTVMRRAH